MREPTDPSRLTLAEKHARRLRQQIADHGCPVLVPEFDDTERLWCPACVDREQIARLLDELTEIHQSRAVEEVRPGLYVAKQSTSIFRRETISQPDAVMQVERLTTTPEHQAAVEAGLRAGKAKRKL
jgi:hypothetical protein